MAIILYDIPSAKVSGNAWSANTWKTRYTLNIMGLPFKTEWVEYPDIEPLAKKLGIPPTSKKPDGSPYYTLPAIYDPSTKTYVSESQLIAEYLNRTYPDSPSLFPNNTLGLQSAFEPMFMANIRPLWTFLIPVVFRTLNPASSDYFRRTREQVFGKTMEELAPTGEAAVVQWNQYKEELGKVAILYEKNGGKGPFIMGESPCWVDVLVASYTIWLRILWGEHSQQWKDVASWHGGRFNALIEGLKVYEGVI
ncbi:hypothetical protein GALMADRAFT_89103 [Galerina marginata CBS 339.88]|uniref:GST N-terminal domain-containing protein n=1 Tax=Galerina marginata (strain CBS 339.88) TaxID=685588 RepID=A0A067TJA7_GALM3|nr:hypothetical protein GALMADRAFT_89103 [Galerina marginata CBS 339.88]